MTTEKINIILHAGQTVELNEETGDRRFTVIKHIEADHGVQRKITGKITEIDLPSGGKMVSGSANQLRNYILRDIETSEELKKRFDIEHAITEGLRMQARGRAAPLPRPKPLDVYVQHAVDNWSDYK